METIKCCQITLQTADDEVVSRFSIMQQAYKTGIKGFVKRKSSTSLLIEAECTEDKLAAFIDWCRQGSEYIKTKKMEVVDSDIKNYTSFDII